jgi:hypothetical protein
MSQESSQTIIQQEYISWRENVWIEQHQNALKAARFAFTKYQDKKPNETEEQYEKRIQHAIDGFHRKRGWCMDPFSCFDEHENCENLRQAAYGSTQKTNIQTKEFQQQIQEKKNII